MKPGRKILASQPVEKKPRKPWFKICKGVLTAVFANKEITLCYYYHHGCCKRIIFIISKFDRQWILGLEL